MEIVLPSWTQLVIGVGALATAVLAIWTLWTKVKKAIRHALIEAVDDRFASRQDVKRVEDQVESLANSVQALTYQTSRVLDFFERRA